MPRFVVLRHEMPGDATRSVHWDLMLEQGDYLRTWALPVRPGSGTQTPIEATQLPNHRVDYLAYEGTISQDRGHVTRVDRGTYAVLAETQDELVLRCAGQHLRGKARLWRAPNSDQGWMFAIIEE